MRPIYLAAALVMLALAGACGSDGDKDTAEATAAKLHRVAESSCRTFADCEGGDTAWIEGCVGEADSQIAAAESHGCLDIMAAWFNCLDDNSTCTADNDYTDDGACHDQEELAENCRNGRL